MRGGGSTATRTGTSTHGLGKAHPLSLGQRTVTLHHRGAVMPALHQTLQSLLVGTPVTAANLTMVPLLSRFRMMTLSTAPVRPSVPDTLS